MEASDKVTIRVLSDEPTVNDPWNTHTSIARAIRNLIESNDGGISIALTGAYGSGKSSVIEILRQRPPEKTDIFVFDAWAHQKDPLRRSFLESLTAFFLNKKLSPIDANKWNEKLKELSGKKVKTNTKEFPSLNAIGFFILALTVSIPAGITLLNIQKESSNVWTGIGFALAIGAPAVLFLAFLTLLSSSIKPFAKFNEKCKHFFSPMSGRGVTEIVSETHQTGDPTSLEFESFFKTLLDEAIGRNDHKIAIVIDNMDRVAIDDALSIWATMRTFFNEDTRYKRSWRKRLWLIVAYDKTAIARLWNDPSPNSPIAKAFSEKTFQIRFDVPPQVLENWSSYFEKHLGEAFLNQIDPEEMHAVYLIFSLKVYAETSSPTPRDIITFINRLGALYLKWGKLIPLQVQAFYVALERSPEGFSIDVLVNNPAGLLFPCTEDIVGEGYEKYLAAIYYNVDPNIAMHTLVVPYLSKAIESRDYNQLLKVAELPGFTKVCESYVGRRTSSWNTHAVDEVSICANLFSRLAPKSDSSWEHVWDTLHLGLLRTNQWYSFDEFLGTGIVALIRRYPRLETASAFIRIFSASPLFEEYNRIIPHAGPENAIAGLRIVLEEIEQYSFKSGLPKIRLFYSKGDPHHLKTLYDDNPDLKIVREWCN